VSPLLTGDDWRVVEAAAVNPALPPEACRRCCPAAQTVSAEMPPRPDGLYGVSKVAVEALGRL
jgi:hypothetical protein